MRCPNKVFVRYKYNVQGARKQMNQSDSCFISALKVIFVLESENGACLIETHHLGKGSKKKTVKKRSGKCENFSTSCHIWGYFVVL